MNARIWAAALAAVALLVSPAWGQGGTTASHKAVTCLAAATSVVPANNTRRVLVLFNNETSDAIAVGTSIPAAQTSANSLLIQPKAALVLDGYRGPMDCMRTGSTDANLRVMEVTQ